MNTPHPASDAMRVRDQLKSLYRKLIECQWFKKITRTPCMIAGAVVGTITVFGFGFTLVISILWFAFSSDRSPDTYTDHAVNRADYDGYGYQPVYGGGFTDCRGGFHSRAGISHGTFDQSGGGNHVISVDGEVLNLPPY
jgi:hypothetical protein